MKLSSLSLVKYALAAVLTLLFGTAYSQYPATGNKARLGWQTTGDGLVYRGAIADTSTLDPSGLNNAWMLLDTVNGSLYAYRSKAWQLVSGGGGVSMPFDSVTFNINEGDASEQELKYSAEKGYLQYGGLDSVQIPLLPGIWYVRNDTSITIPKGTVVRASGTLGASGRIKVKHMIADGSIPAMYVLGIAMHDIATGADGYVMTQGKIRQVNTQAYSEGAVLYADVDTLGGLTQTEPTGSNLKLPIAFVVNSASNGTIAVRVTSGAYMRDLHDAEITSPVSNASLYYNAAQGVWRDTGAAVLVADTSAMLSQYLKESELSFSSTTGVSSFSTVVVNSFNALPWDGARVVGITTITGSTGEITLDLNGNQVILDISANLSLSGTTDTIELQSSTGTSVHFLAGQNVNLTHSNDTMTISVPISVSTNLSFSGASDTIGLQSGTGQKVFFREGDNINITQAQDTMALDVPLALSISTSLAAGPSTVIVDGLNKLPWDGTYVIGITAAATAGVTITLNDQSVSFNPLQFIDTSAMLSSYVNFADTAAMLSPYLKKADTLSLSNRINAKLNISDTTAMLNPYLKKADTTSLSNRINTKLNISDTSVFARDFQISGTANYLAKFTGSNAVGNSGVFESGGNVGIGITAVPYAKLNVNNSIRITDGGTGAGSNTYGLSQNLYIGNDGGGVTMQYNASNGMDIYTYDAVWNRTFTIDKTGRFGIGEPTPARILHIVNTGAIRIPVGNFAQRGTSGAGDIRVRNDTANLEFHNGTAWQTVATQSYVTDNAISTVYIPINLYAPGDTVANTTDSKAFFMVHSGLNGYCIDSYTVKAISGSGTADIQIDKNGTGANAQSISGTTVATKDTNIALATGDYIRGQVFNLSGTLVGLGLTLEIKKTCN